MQNRTRRSNLWVVAITLALLAAVTPVVGSGTAAAQAGPQVSAPGLQYADVGHQMCLQLTATGSGPITYTAGSPLPGGISITESGLVQGPPSQIGTFPITVNATDDNGTTPISFDLKIYTPTKKDIVIKAGRFDTGFTIDCFSQGRAANSFISDSRNFGPNGTVKMPRGLVIHEQTTPNFLVGGARIDAAYLADADILFDGWVNDERWNRAELKLIENWVNAGGVLVTAEDNPLSDRLGSIFGATSAGFSHCGEPGDPPCPRFAPNPKARNHAINSGPFGRWSSLQTSGSVGNFGRKPTGGWKIVGRDADKNATVMERRVGNGHVIAVSDEALFRVNLGGDNGRFLGNLVKFAVDQVSKAPLVANDVFTGRIWRDFSANICANDESKGDKPSRITIVSGSLPPRLTLNGCRITGIPVPPQSLGSYAMTYRITDKDGDTATAQVQITINGDNPAPTNPRCKGQQAKIIGTPGDDVIVGTPDDDVIIAGNGNDTIDGGGGNDIICGGRGNDIIVGGRGTDRLFGEGGKDTLSGSAGKGDLCHGGKGRDIAADSCERRRKI